ncbi:hypothetical protein AB0P19_11020 [Microbacterium oleivorans]|uniref:hypothetical protein n=1 Tax=Microbacterium oleivorans TaxID=273677 RepID=UPI0033C3BEE5
MPTVAIPYVPMPANQNPNIKVRADSDNVYMKAALVALASFSRWNPGWDLALVTNGQVSEYWRNLFGSIGARVDLLSFHHEPPVGFMKAFAGSLFLLDAVQDYGRSDYLLLIDPDVLAVGKLPSLPPDQALALRISSDLDETINGLKLRHAVEIAESLTGKVQAGIHFGGELYGLPQSIREQASQWLSEAWKSAQERFSVGETHFITEEHMMTFVLGQISTQEASKLIRRIWTAHGYRTVRGDEDEVPLWHLPAEKERAFAAIFPAVLDGASWFWTSDEVAFRDTVAALTGMRNRSAFRLGRDALGHVIDRSRKTARRFFSS